MKSRRKIVWILLVAAAVSLSLATGFHIIFSVGICLGVFNGFFMLKKNIDENLPD